MLSPVAQGGDAIMLAENPPEIAGVLKAAAQGDLLDIQIRGEKQMAAKLQTALDEILYGGHVKAAAEAAQTLAFAYKGRGGYIIQCNVFDIILTDEAQHLF